MAELCKGLNFLIATWEGGGSVGPKLTLARKLLEAGHSVRVMSDACNRPEAEKVGATFVPWTRAPSRTDRFRESELFRDWAASSPAEGFQEVVENVFAGPSLAYAQDVIEELEREPADLVVSSDFLVGVMAGCEAIGQPLVAMSCNSILFPLDDAPLAGPDQDLLLTPEGAAQAAAMKDALRAVLDTGLPALNTARAVLGLSPVNSLVDQLSSARSCLIAISRHFDMASDPVPSGFRYVGPQIDAAAWTGEWQSPWAADDVRPLVVVAFSTTFQNHIGVVQNVIDALADLPVRVLVTRGPTIREGELAAAENTVIVPNAPHDIVMQEAAMVVTHGGHGTLARAMVNRLPLLVMPHGRDQDGNAARIEAHGAGLSLPPSASVSEIGEAARRLLSDSELKYAAWALGEAVARETRESRIVEELEELCCPTFA